MEGGEEEEEEYDDDDDDYDDDDDGNNNKDGGDHHDTHGNDGYNNTSNNYNITAKRRYGGHEYHQIQLQLLQQQQDQQLLLQQLLQQQLRAARGDATNVRARGDAPVATVFTGRSSNGEEQLNRVRKRVYDPDDGGNDDETSSTLVAQPQAPQYQRVVRSAAEVAGAAPAAVHPRRAPPKFSSPPQMARIRSRSDTGPLKRATPAPAQRKKQQHIQQRERAPPLAPAPEGARRAPAEEPHLASHTARCRAKVNGKFTELLSILPPPPQNVSVRHKAQVLQYTCSVLEALVARQRALEAELILSSDERIEAWLRENVVAKRTVRDALTAVVRLVMSLTGWKYGDLWLPVRSASVSSGVEARSIARAGAAQLPASLPSQPPPPPLQFAVGIVQDGRSRSDLLYDFARACQGVVLRPPSGVPGRVYMSQRPEWMSSISDPPTFERAGIARNTGVAACLGLPLMVNGRVVAVIAVYDTSGREYDEEIVKLSQTVMEAVSSALSTAPKFAGEF